MIDARSITEIISQYSKHGWRPRRVLLSDSLRKQLSDLTGGLFGDAEMIFSDIDAMWFSRSSRPGRETWELRQLSNSPYALDAFLDSEMDAATREEILTNTEDRLRDARAARSQN